MIRAQFLSKELKAAFWKQSSLIALLLRNSNQWNLAIFYIELHGQSLSSPCLAVTLCHLPSVHFASAIRLNWAYQLSELAMSRAVTPCRAIHLKCSSRKFEALSLCWVSVLGLSRRYADHMRLGYRVRSHTLTQFQGVAWIIIRCKYFPRFKNRQHI